MVSLRIGGKGTLVRGMFVRVFIFGREVIGLFRIFLGGLFVRFRACAACLVRLLALIFWRVRAIFGGFRCFLGAFLCFISL